MRLESIATERHRTPNWEISKPSWRRWNQTRPSHELLVSLLVSVSPQSDSSLPPRPSLVVGECVWLLHEPCSVSLTCFFLTNRPTCWTSPPLPSCPITSKPTPAPSSSSLTTERSSTRSLPTSSTSTPNVSTTTVEPTSTLSTPPRRSAR